MSDSLVSMGYVPKVLQGLNSNQENLRKICCEILRFFGSSGAILEILINFDSIELIVKGLKKLERGVGLVCEGVNGIFSSGGCSSELVAQGVRFGLVEILLSFLRGKDHLLEDPDGGVTVASVKANIVHALQAMARDSVYGADVEGVLGASDVWKGYRGQVIINLYLSIHF